MSKTQIKTANNWIDRRNPFTADTTRILMVLFANIKKQQDTGIKSINNTIRTPVLKIASLFTSLGNDKNILSRLRDVNEELINKPIGYIRDTGDNNWKMLGSAINSVELSQGILTINLNPDVTEYVLLEKHYTLSYIEAISNLTTINQINLYNTLIRYAKLQKIKLSILDIKTRLNIADDKYKLPTNFINKVIKPSINAIKKHSDLIVNYTTKKTTRSITHIEFSIAFKNKLQTLDYKDNTLTERLVKLGIDNKSIQSLIKNYNQKIIADTLDYVEQQKDKKQIFNIKAYLFTTLTKNIIKDKQPIKQFIITGYITSLTAEQSNKLWINFENQVNKTTKELIKSYNKTSASNVKDLLKKEINNYYYKYIYNNKLQGE